MKFNYIVAFYIGSNRTIYKDIFEKDPLLFFKKQINFLKNNKKNNLYPTFVFNDDIENNLKKEIEQTCNNKIEVVFRKNEGFSYGAWNDIVTNNINKYDNFFLIEDDYIPCENNFLNHYFKKIKENTCFVCGLVDRFTNYNATFKFASISNGLLSGDACKIILKKSNFLFNIIKENDYNSGYQNQIYFLKNFTDMGYDIVDILDEFKSTYFDSSHKICCIYGDKNNKDLLKPIFSHL